METINLVNKDQCTGCAACANICAKGCIEMQPDKEGFLYPQIDRTACISCGQCMKVCPALHPNQKKPNSNKVIACWSKNAQTRYMSTSGGAFSELSEKILQESGVVCGAKYREDFSVAHCLIDRSEDIPLVRQSKYIQSDMGAVLKDIKAAIANNQKVLFVGCPCQTAAVYAYLNGKTENIYLVDFICRGVNSPKALAAFLKMLEEKAGSKVKRVWFKNKESGWNCFSTRVDFENGEYYLKNRYEDSYIQGYIKHNLYLRPCCYDCQYKDRTNIVADITLGDFWGVGQSYPEMDTDLGTSMMILNTPKGEALFHQVQNSFVFKEADMGTAFHGNPCLRKSAKRNRKRNAFMKNLDKLGFEKAYLKYSRPSVFMVCKKALLEVYYALGHFVMGMIRIGFKREKP